jgi:hypothetical protein
MSQLAPELGQAAGRVLQPVEIATDKKVEAGGIEPPMEGTEGTPEDNDPDDS